MIALLLTVASGLSYPGGTVRDESIRGYSFAHKFLSDLGSTVAFNYQRNTVDAVLFGVSVLIGVLVLAGSIVATIRLLSATPRARSFARLAAVVGVLACAGFIGVALAPQIGRGAFICSRVWSRSDPFRLLLHSWRSPRRATRGFGHEPRLAGGR